jgi:hypothetical protein
VNTEVEFTEQSTAADSAQDKFQEQDLATGHRDLDLGRKNVFSQRDGDRQAPRRFGLDAEPASQLALDEFFATLEKAGRGL